MFHGQERRQEEKSSEKSQHGVLPQTIQSLLAPGSFELSGNESSSQKRRRAPPVHQQRTIVHTASQAVRSGEHIEKKKRAMQNAQDFTQSRRNKKYIYNRRPSRPGEKQIHSDYGSVPRNGNEVLPLFFPPPKKTYTHAHSTTPLPAGALVYRFGDEVEKALGVLLRMHRRDLCPCTVLHCLCCLRSAFLHAVMCEHVH